MTWEQAAEALRATHPQVRVTLGTRCGDRVLVALIRTDGPRGQGLAGSALAALCAAADAHHVTLALTPEPMGKGVSRARLTRWYARHGFAPVPARRGDGEFAGTWQRRPR